MSSEACTGVARSIKLTIGRLQRSAVGPNSLGCRYARLLYLLWRKSPEQVERHHDKTRISQNEGLSHSEQATSGLNSGRTTEFLGAELDPFTGFSWRDLGAVGHFIANDTSVTESMLLPSPSAEIEQIVTPGIDEGGIDWYEALCSENHVVF